MRKIWLCALVTLTFSATGYPKTIHVPGDHSKIQEAVDAAAQGDTVLVAPGTYMESKIDFKGKAISVTSTNGPETTVINAQKNGSVFIFMNAEGSDSVLSGLTLKRGSGTWESGMFSYGGGIYCKGASPTILDNIITLCAADKGGGISCGDSSAALIQGNIIHENTADWGGGINCEHYSTGRIEANIIHGNTGKVRAGGIYCNYFADPLIINNRIFGNNATYYGGGFLLRGASPLLINNTITDNSSMWGGGIFFYSASSELVNNLIYGNTALEAGGGIYTFAAAAPVVHNSIFWKNTAVNGPQVGVGSKDAPSSCSLDHCNVEGGQGMVYVDSNCTLNWGTGMIDADPLFVDPADRDFHLTFPSPCKDTGDNNAVTESTDFEGDPRIAYGTVDMGADEFYIHLYHTGDATPGGNVEVKIVGLPGTMPVGLCIGSGLLDPPIPSIWGDWYLQFPIIGPIDLGSIPSPDGILMIPGTIPLSPPAPYSILMQALIGTDLTNPSILIVK